MIVAWTIVLIAGLAQAPQAPDGVIPYEFQLKSSEEPLYALVNPDDLDKSRFEVHLYEPWNRSLISDEIKKHTLSEDPTPAEGATYRHYLRSEWKANGGVEVGDTWVLEEQYVLMKRASAMTQQPTIEVVIEPVVDEPEEVTLATIDTVEVGFMTQWGMHGLIGLVTLVLMGFVIRWGFFARVWLGVGL